MNRSRKSPDQKNRADQRSLSIVGKSPSWFKLGLIALGLAALGSFSAQAGDKTFNFDTDPNGVLDFFGTSVWTPTGGNPATGGFLEVTSALGSQKGTIIFDDFDAGLIVKSFTFSMDLKIGDGTASPADGFSINYCSADDPLIVAHDGNGWAASPGNEANLPEEGTQTGLGVGFDAWNSGSGDIIGISVRVDNVLLTQIPMPTLNGAATDPTSLQTGPRANGDGLGAGLTWQPLKLQLDENAILNIWWKNVQIVTNLQTTFFPRPGRIVFGGRTGGSWQLQSVDNIHIVTVAAGSPLIGGLTGTADGFKLVVNDSPGNPLVTNSLTAKLDGNNVTFKSVVTQGASNVFIMSSFPTLLPSGSAHSLDVSYLDAQGKTAVYTNKTITVPVYTTMAATETAPADKVDKTAAGFVANVVQANSVATLANTAERAEFQLRGELMNGSTPYANVANAGPFNIDGIINWNKNANGVGVELGDFQSPDYPDAPIPGVDGLLVDPATGSAATWANDNVAAEITGVLDLTKGVYTFGVNSDDGFRVTFGSSQFDVLNTTYGLYEGGKGASDVLFTVVAFDDGLYPFRLVWYNGNGDSAVEFFSVAADGKKIPVNDIVAGAIKSYKAVAANKPARVQVASPMPGGLGISPLASVEVELVDGATTVNKDSVTLNVLGAAVTPTVTKNGTLTKVVYTHDILFPQGSNITAILVYLDSASKSITNTWTFTTMSGAVVIPASFALPATSGQTPGFSSRLVQTSDGGANTIVWNEDLLAGNGAQSTHIIYRAFDEPDVINYWGSGGLGNFANDAVNLPGGAGADLANYAMEMIAYVQLDKGIYTFGVNSDDGFDLTFGAEPHAKSVRVASVDVGRGVADTDSTIIISTNGLYPLRLMFFQGGGGDACELYYKDSAGGGSTNLINDSTAAKYIKAYRYSTALSTAVTLTQQPSNTTITAYTPLRLTVAATSGTITNPALFAFQWMKGGADIAGENGPTYYRQFAAPDEAGTYSCKVILLGYKAVTSASATVTVNSDSAPPIVVGAKGGASFKTVTISFNKAIDVGSAFDLANYSISGLTLDNTIGPVMLNVTNVVLATALQTQGKSYTVTVTGVKSMGGVAIAGSNTATFSGFVEVAGFATLEFFDNIGGGTTVADLTGNAKFLGNQADRVMANTSFETLSWENGDNYGGRATAILTAPASGNYTFYIASDDNSALFISTDENPVDVLSATPIAMVSSVTTDGYSNQREWGKNAEQKSAPQTLVAGKKYYVTALWKEGGGGDGVAVGWTKPGETATNAIPGSVLSGFINPDASSVTITTQPKALTVTQSRPVTFTVAATGISDVGTTVSYQWQRNGVDIVGATGATYAFPLATMADNGVKFKVVVSVPAKSVASDEVMLTVNADTVTPTIVSARTLVSGQKVGIVFDERLDKSFAELSANYIVTGATVTNAVLQPNGMSVVLSLDIAVTAGATVTVNGLKDVAGNPIAANAQIAIAFGGRVALFVVTGGATPTLNASDALVQSRLESRGYEVQVIGSDVDDVSMATGKNIVVISSTMGSGTVAGTYKTVTVPVLDWEQAIQDDMAWTTVTGTTDRGSTTGLTTIEIVDATHPMAAGLPAGVVTIATAASEFAWGQPDANAKVVARLVGTTANACIYGYDKGALLTDGTPAAERRVLFLMTDNVAVNLNDTGWKLFDAAIDWAQSLGGAQPAAPLITSAKDATGKVVITFEGTLQSAPAVVGPWTDVVGASPLTVTPAGMQFYRAKK